MTILIAQNDDPELLEWLANADVVANLIYAAMAFGHAGALKGWSLEQTVEEGKKL